MISSQTHAVVALDSDVDRDVVEAMLSAEPLRVLDYVDLGRLAPDDDGAGDVLIVACVDYTADVGESLAAAVRHHPARPVVLLCPAGSNGYVEEAFGAGVDDIVALPTNGSAEAAGVMSQQVIFTVEKAVARKRGSAVATTHLGTMISVLGLKGGSGKTLTATNLAVALADAGNRVTIVDIDLQFGDVGLALGLSPERTVFDLIGSGGSLDAEKLEDFLAVHPSGARALLAPARPDQAGVVTSDFLRDVYAVLREVQRLRDRGHAAELYAGGDRRRGQLDGGLHGGDARLAVAEELQARARDARTDELRHGQGAARAQSRRQQRGNRPRGRRRDHGRRAADSGA